MSKERILVVDDEEDIRRLMEYSLVRDGFVAYTAESGLGAMNMVHDKKPDLIILDLMLPDMDGLDVCRAVRSNAETSTIPIIMVTAKGEDADIVAGLELGADDYITKPFSPRVLIARIKTVLKRAKKDSIDDAEMVRIGDISIDPGRHRVTLEDQIIDLTATEFRILHYLARRPGWVFTRYQIVEMTQGDDADVTDRSVDVHVVSLRKKLGDAGNLIETVRGVGYRFKE